MRALGAVLFALALSGGCAGSTFSIWIEPPVEHPEPPVPGPLRGDSDPELVECGIEGVLRAPELDPHLYYVESEQLWYRYWRKRWYQAFHWSGYWFPPECVPEGLRDAPPGALEGDPPDLPEPEAP